MEVGIVINGPFTLIVQHILSWASLLLIKLIWNTNIYIKRVTCVSYLYILPNDLFLQIQDKHVEMKILVLFPLTSNRGRLALVHNCSKYLPHWLILLVTMTSSVFADHSLSLVRLRNSKEHSLPTTHFTHTQFQVNDKYYEKGHVILLTVVISKTKTATRSLWEEHN